MLNNLLFIYGTLLQPDNEFALYLQKNASFYSSAKFEGKLYDIGNYPGVVAYPDGELYVQGNIVQLNNPKQVLKTIDPYEGFGAGQPKPYLFIRKLIKAETTNGDVTCWIYLYNRPVIGLHQITSGDYLEYKRKKSR